MEVGQHRFLERHVGVAVVVVTEAVVDGHLRLTFQYPHQRCRRSSPCIHSWRGIGAGERIVGDSPSLYGLFAIRSIMLVNWKLGWS